MPGVTMRLAVAENAWLEYEYLIYNKQAPERDYLVDFNVRLVNMAPHGQPDFDRHRLVECLVPEREGVPERKHVHDAGLPFSGRKFDRGAGYERRRQVEERIDGGELGAFKQQFFSSVFIAPQNVSSANMAFDTAAPGSELLKSFSVQMAVPYSAQVEGYDFRILLRSQQICDPEESHRQQRCGTSIWSV